MTLLLRIILCRIFGHREVNSLDPDIGATIIACTRCGRGLAWCWEERDGDDFE